MIVIKKQLVIVLVQVRLGQKYCAPQVQPDRGLNSTSRS